LQKIAPFLWFNNNAEEAVNFYVSIFKNSKIEDVSRYTDAGPGPSGAVMVIAFQLEGQDFKALNGFQPAASGGGMAPISLFVDCETQAEVDRLWEKLSAGGEIQQCGWLRDKFVFTWNIVPAGLGALLGGPDPVKAQRAMTAMLKMEKLDIDALRRAYEGQ
jgi:predicted 3-demethylubiquinone-9 3-methyltransferase (glyoxalase superfamily)